jgi:hypothetical protein
MINMSRDMTRRQGGRTAVPLDLHPDIERQILARAQAAGITANDYVARLLQAAAPGTAPDPVARVRRLLSEWQQHDHTPTATPAPIDGTLTPSEALFRQWEEEDAGLTDDERQAEENYWQEFQQSINAERTAAGMRPIF